MSSEELPPSKRMKIDNLTNHTETLDEIVKSDNIDQSEETDVAEIKPCIVKDTELNLDNLLESNASTSQYNKVTREELQKLREFQVLDEVNEDDDSKDEDSDTSDKSEDLPEDEIERMLEEDLPEGFKGAPKPKEKSYVTRQKTVLEEKGINHFEVLPLDWMMVRHCSGMPVYMHRGTRVCTLSKPYFLGKGNTRRHDIPISAIPCLAYRKALEEEEKQREIDHSIADQIANGTWANNAQYGQHTKLNNLGKQEQLEDLEKIQSITFNDGKTDQDINKFDKQEKDQQLNKLDLEKNQQVNKLDNQQSDQANKATNQSKSDQTDLKTNHNENQKMLTTHSLSQESQIIDKNTNATEKLNSESMEVVNTDSLDDINKATCPFSKDLPSRKPVVLPGGIVMPPPRVETVNTSWKTQHLLPEELNDYCKNLFKFKNVNIMHFKRWADRRKYVKARKTLQYPTLPEGTKLITIPAQSHGQENNGKTTKRDWVMNMNGCSYLSVFHEYVRRALQKQPVYEFKQLENAATPYQATVYIGGMQYGVGHGSSKRQAKSAAAKASIHILIPEMKDELDEHAKQNTTNDTTNEPDFSFFDYVGIEDPRIAEFCAATSEPSPHAILRTCLLRNFGAGDRHIHTEMKKLEYQKMELTMRVGKHSATVVCKNKKQAKQRASQAILQALHPHIKSWGSLLRLYGSRSVKSSKEKKLEEQQITLLQDKAQQNEPNYAVLEKLRNEMRKLKERDEAVIPIGKLLVADDLPTHSGSMLNNVDL